MITLHVVASLDGFIANKDNTVEWMDSSQVYEKGVSFESAGEAMDPIDCYILGAKTFEHALELGWPYGDTPVVVVTSRKLPSTRKSVEFYSGDLKKLVDGLARRFKNTWLVGGAVLGQSFLKLDLVDAIRLMVAPVLLGDGLRLFGDAGEMRWLLKGAVPFQNGMVGLSYEKPVTNPPA